MLFTHAHADHIGTLGRFVAAGVPVTINSDDPPMFGTTLNDEYLVAADLLRTITSKPSIEDAVILAIIISETTSNTASVAVVVPIIIPVALAAGITGVVGLWTGFITT